MMKCGLGQRLRRRKITRSVSILQPCMVIKNVILWISMLVWMLLTVSVRMKIKNLIPVYQSGWNGGLVMNRLWLGLPRGMICLIFRFLMVGEEMRWSQFLLIWLRKMVDWISISNSTRWRWYPYLILISVGRRPKTGIWESIFLSSKEEWVPGLAGIIRSVTCWLPGKCPLKMVLPMLMLMGRRWKTAVMNWLSVLLRLERKISLGLFLSIRVR